MSTVPSTLPLIGVSACIREILDGQYHTVGMKYVAAVADGAGGIPVLVPAIGDAADGGRLHVAELVERLDGLMLTGSPSNVEPHHYGGERSRHGTLHDPERDATILPLIRAALDNAVPLLAVCRGTQELNVALGGTLHQNVHELPGKRDHRMRREGTWDVRHGPAHPVRFRPDSLLARLAREVGHDPEHTIINSLHAQAIDVPAPGLTIEAWSDDDVIEAISVESARAFALGVQWHPEYRVTENKLSMALFRAFGDACRARAAARLAADRVA